MSYRDDPVTFNPILDAIDRCRPPDRPALIAIDGRGGSGKSTLAARLAREMPDVCVVHLDDFATPPSGGDRQRLLDQVIVPLKGNRVARYQRFDWRTRKLANWITIQPKGIVVIEGVLTLHELLYRHYDLRIWIECPAEIGFKRGLARDLTVSHIDTERQWIDIWMPEERRAIDEHRPFEKADIIMDGTAPQGTVRVLKTHTVGQ